MNCEHLHISSEDTGVYDNSQIIHRYENVVKGTLRKRYKRFLVDVELENKTIVCCHIANTGSMLGMLPFGAELRLVDHEVNKRRSKKLRYSVEAVKVNGVWIGCNTALANRIVGNMLKDEEGRFPEFAKFIKSCIIAQSQGSNFRVDAEVASNEQKGCRYDFRLTQIKDKETRTSTSSVTENPSTCTIEVKHVSMASDWWAVEKFFPCAAVPPRIQNFSRQDRSSRKKRKHSKSPFVDESTTEQSVQLLPSECRDYMLKLCGSNVFDTPISGMDIERVASLAALNGSCIKKTALFPDSVTERGYKHLRGLIQNAKNVSSRNKQVNSDKDSQSSVCGDTSCMVYYVARGDCDSFSTSNYCYPAYHCALQEALIVQGFYATVLAFDYVVSDIMNSYILFKGIIPLVYK